MLLLLVDVIHRRERRMGDITVHIDVHIVVHIGGDVIIHRAIAKGIVPLVLHLMLLLLLHHKGRLVATLVVVVEEAIMISLVVSFRNIIGFGMIYLDVERHRRITEEVKQTVHNGHLGWREIDESIILGSSSPQMNLAVLNAV